MLCVTGVYLRDVTNTILVILHLNVSHLSVYSFCFFVLLGGGVVVEASFFELMEQQHFNLLFTDLSTVSSRGSKR